MVDTADPVSAAAKVSATAAAPTAVGTGHGRGQTIPGVTSGIGLGLARRFAAAGNALIVAGRRNGQVVLQPRTDQDGAGSAR